MHKSIFNNKIKNKESSTVGADSKSRKKNKRKRQSNNSSTQIQYSTLNDHNLNYISLFEIKYFLSAHVFFVVIHFYQFYYIFKVTIMLNKKKKKIMLYFSCLSHQMFINILLQIIYCIDMI
jgi:hypothetical protein